MAPAATVRTASRPGRAVPLLCLAIACGCKTASVEPPAPEVVPAIRRAAAIANATNVLSAVVTVTSTNAAAVAVDVLRDTIEEQTTPFVPVVSDSAAVPVYGLRAHTEYRLRARVVSTTGETALSPLIAWTTDSLPRDFPSFTLLRSQSPSVRYVLFGIIRTVPGRSYAVIIDTAGTPVWYRAFHESVLDFQDQPNGRYTAWSTTDGTDPWFHEFDRLGAITARYRAADTLETDPHELRFRGAAYALFGLDYRSVDLTPLGGMAAATVKGVVVEYRRPGREPFLWNTFDHFEVADAAPDIVLTGANVNPWHGNALEIDADGNILASFRNMDEITKIDAQTGEIVWRLGGKRNQIKVRGDGLGGFSHQHGIRRLPNGHILLFDNGNLHIPPSSRAVEYRLDETALTADLVWEYRPDPPLFATATGFAQRLENGNTLVCFGTANHAIEADPAGNNVWEVRLEGDEYVMYRAVAIPSLY